jgi:hypothetical protein
MIQVKITPEIIRRAKKKAASVGVLQGSITGSLSNVVGAIGEIIVQDYTGGIEANSKDYDLMIGLYWRYRSQQQGLRLDDRKPTC